MRSLIRQNFLMALVSVIIGLLICIFVFYELQSLKGWGVAVDNAGKLRGNALWLGPAPYLYFNRVCLHNEDSKYYLQKFEAQKKLFLRP